MIDAKSLIEMLESSYDGIWITDGNGRILFANSANASLLGVTKRGPDGKEHGGAAGEKDLFRLCVP